MINIKFYNWLLTYQDEANLFPPELDAQEALSFLTEYLLGKDWSIPLSLNAKQANTVIVKNILYKYSKNFKKECYKINKNKKIYE